MNVLVHKPSHTWKSVDYIPGNETAVSKTMYV